MEHDVSLDRLRLAWPYRDTKQASPVGSRMTRKIGLEGLGLSLLYVGAGFSVLFGLPFVIHSNPLGQIEGTIVLLYLAYLASLSLSYLRHVIVAAWICWKTRPKAAKKAAAHDA